MLTFAAFLLIIPVVTRQADALRTRPGDATEEATQNTSEVSQSCWPIPDSKIVVSVDSNLQLGNALSQYLEGLARATLANVPFESRGTKEVQTFLKHLPNSLPAPRPEGPSWGEAVQSVCQRCYSKLVKEYPHHCLGAWADPRVFETLRKVIRDALTAHGLDRVKEQLRDGEAVVHLRCSSGAFLVNPVYGPPAFSLFDDIPENTPRITFVEGPRTSTQCIDIREAGKAYIQARLPKTEMRVLFGSADPDSISEDFARLAFAPILVRGVGTFSLWSALANPNKVISVKNPHGWTWKSIDFGNFRWSNAPVLTPQVSRETFGSKVNLTSANMENLVLPWLKQH